MASQEAEGASLPPELQVQGWWHAGLLPREGHTEHHGAIRILDVGLWNRSHGPDFLRAEIELEGVRLRGDIEIDPHPQDWEQHGHGANPVYNNVVLHVVLSRPASSWYTRNSQHREVPVLYLGRSALSQAAGMGYPERSEDIPRCRQPLAQAKPEHIRELLQAAAAHRLEKRHRLFLRKAEFRGLRQCWYEAWAETLGYAANKEAMQMLAHRAPLQELQHQAEAILLGTADFLLPVLPEQCSHAARQYHRRIWDSWWALREQFELSPARKLPWAQGPSRPLNHPQRRVAALALSARKWEAIEPLLSVMGYPELCKVLSGLEHPFWDTHCTLASVALPRKVALVGRQRMEDFFINHLCAYDASAGAWQAFLAHKAAGKAPETIQRTAWNLFGQREELRSLLRHSYARQALLQIEADFCARSICLECAFPSQLQQWCRG